MKKIVLCSVLLLVSTLSFAITIERSHYDPTKQCLKLEISYLGGEKASSFALEYGPLDSAEPTNVEIKLKQLSGLFDAGEIRHEQTIDCDVSGIPKPANIRIVDDEGEHLSQIFLLK